MQKKEERQHKMDEYLTERFASIFPERTLQTMRYASDNAARLAHSLLSAIEDGASEAKQKIADGKKGPITYLQLSYLLSDIPQKKLTLKIDCFDERYYGDLREIDAYWDYSELFPYIDEDMAILHKELGNTFIRFMDYEIWDIRQCYHIWIFILMKDIVKNLIAGEEASQLLADIRGSELAVLYGAYLDQAEVIRMIGGREG